jgi:amidase
MLLLAVAIPAPITAQGFELLEATIEDAHSAMEDGRVTCRSLVQGYIDRIEAFDQTGPRLNAIQHLNQRALEKADSLDASMRSTGISGPLHCIPVLLKDQVETADMPTT